MKQNPYTPGSDQWRAWNKGYRAAHNEWRDSALESIRKRNAPRRLFRESKLGRFVTGMFAKQNPDTTQRETVG
jgi:hypothetical protein